MPDVSARLSRPAALWWHVGFALAVGVAAVALLLAGAAGPLVGWALAAAAAPGVAGLLLRTRGDGALSRLLILCWGAGAAVAAILTGGASGPLGVLAVMPALGALVLGGGGRLSEGGAASLGALGAAGLAQAAGYAPSSGETVRLWLSLFSVAAVVLFGGAALIGVLRARAEAGATGDDVRRLRAALSAARARIQAVEQEAADERAANRAKSRFLANMSHELRTPLNAVLGFSDTMRMRMFGPLPDRYAEYAGLIHESGRHLLDLINDVLDMSKIEADRYELEREVFDVAEAAGAALRLMRLQADDAGVALRSALPARPLEVDADRRALKQIVINLLSNALKFTPRGGSVTLTVQAAEGRLELVVADTGVGIAPEDLERLGRPYEQAGPAEQRAQGTGLGLSLVRALVGLHGGSVGLESRMGEGTAVTVHLPVLISDVVAAPPAPAPHDGSEDDAPREASA